MKTPAALVALPLLAGSALGLLFSDNADPSLVLRTAAAVSLALVAAVGWFVDGNAEGTACAVACGCLLAGVALGLDAARDAYRPSLRAWFEARSRSEVESPATLEGTLRDDAAITPFGISLTIDVVQPARGGVRLSVAGDAARAASPDWRAGRALRVTAALRTPAAYGNPGLPDEARALARRGIILVGSIKSSALVEVVGRGTAADEAAAAARAWSRRQIARSISRWNAKSGAIAAAILIGDRTGLSETDERRLQEAGTYHVIAISGGNIALLTAMLVAVLRVLRLPPTPSGAFIVTALLFYGRIASGGPSVSRAVTAACIYLAGRMLDHRAPPMNILAIAAAGALAVSPVAAFDGGFIMSFGATAGILAGAPRLSRRGSVPSLIRPAAALLVATICAEAALVPVSAVLFWRVTLAGLLLNFAAIPLMALTQGAALATLVAGPIDDRAAAVCGLAAHVGAAGLVYSATLVDVAPWLSRDVVPPSWWLIGAYYACCVWLLRARRHVRIAAVCLGCAGLAMFIGPEAVTQSPVRPPAGRVLRVAFLDVGEGDAALVQLPGGRNLLVDAGGVAAGAFDLGERVVAPVLRVLGAPRVDTIALTHGDFDHIGGAHAILRRFGPRTVWEGVPVPPHAGLRSLQEEAAAAGVTWRTVVAGDHERAGGVDIAVLHPPPPDWERQRVRNDDSIVLELRYGEVSIVLPGDIGEEGERAVTGLLAPAAIRILKVPHHGSASSSTPAFLDAARPAAVIFSAGRGNRFGHPAPAVLERYRARRAAIFRTDQDGAIWIDTDGRRVTFTTWSGRSGEISHHFPP